MVYQYKIIKETSMQLKNRKFKNLSILNFNTLNLFKHVNITEIILKCLIYKS